MVKTLGLLVNTQKRSALNLAEKILRWGRKQKIRLVLPPHEAHVLGEEEVSDLAWKETVDAAIVLGGDGTFLRAARYVIGHNIPLYGINVGHLGFLSCGKVENAEHDLELIIQGEHKVQYRQLLHGVVSRGKRQKHEVYALNDLVVTKGPFARLIALDIAVSERPLNVLYADGIIIATPTGSTAYSLSAGGPIVPPHLSCMILTPICAHTLYSRPMVLSESDTITITPQGQHREIMLTQDGQLGYELLPGDCISVSLDPEKKVGIITLPENDYFTLLQEKFQWGHRTTDGGEE
ncbi:MAG: NAD(+)/NADH kinase [Thermovirgaceae bacterium]|nr:NAD(+)/NADH kinase [Thermovirgaceae bacterium]